jgi:hypothetical protein
MFFCRFQRTSNHSYQPADYTTHQTRIEMTMLSLTGENGIS